MLKVHEVKTWPKYFQAVWDGEKTFELRKDDRGYEVGDGLRQWEYDPQAHRGMTGRYTDSVITYIVRDAPHFGLMSGFAVLGLDYFDNGTRDDPEEILAAWDRMKAPDTSRP